MKNNQLYFSSPFELNDPFDCKPYLDYEGSIEEFKNMYKRGNKQKFSKMTESVLKKYSDDTFNVERVNNKETLKEFWVNDLQKRLETVRLCCFSEKKDDILMFSHYADFHRGVCLEFDFENHIMGYLKQITYHSKMPILRFVDDDRVDIDDFIRRILLTKSECWNYEKEWRSLWFYPNHHLVSFPEKVLTGIIMGCQISENDKQHIKTLIANKKTKPKIYQAIKKEREFGLDIVEIKE